MTPRAVAVDLAALALVAVVPLTAIVAGARGPLRLTLNLGPNDGAYIQGFLPLYEITPEDQVATRWTTYDAAVALPIVVRGGPAALSYRFARVLPETAVVETSLAGRLVDRFSCRGGVFETRQVRLAALPATPVNVAFKVDSHDTRKLGLKMDWIRLDLGAGSIAFLAGAARWRPILLVVAVFLMFRWTGFSAWVATLLMLPLAGAMAAWALVDPLGLAHVSAKIALPAVLLGTVAAAVLRSRPGGRWVVSIFLFGYLIKGAGLFYPTTFYPDVMNHRRYVFALVEAEGRLPERGVAAQIQVKTAYPRMVAGRPYAFPYSPLFFVPFTWLPRDAETVEDAMRHAGLAAAAAEVPVAFWIARLVFVSGSGVPAALVAAVLPPLYSRMLFAMWPTLVGHLLDSLAIGAALRLAARPASSARLAGLAATTLAAFLTYISSLFNLTSFLAFFALLERRQAARVIALVVAAGTATVLLLYWPFTVTFFREILPTMGQGGAPASAGGGLGAALLRIPLFYGFGFPALAAAGLVLARRQAEPGAFRGLAAYGLAFLLLVLLRGLGGGLFKDLKETTFVGPLMAVTTGASLEALARTGRAGRWAAVMVGVGLVAFGLGKYAEYLATYASPVTRS